MGSGPSAHSASDKTSDLDSVGFSGLDVVKDKLRALYGEELSGDRLEKFAFMLSDTEKLKKVYLHTDFEEAKKLQKTIKDMVPDRDSQSDLQSISTPVTDSVDPFLDMNNKIRVKLIVSETSRNKMERTLRRVISPFVNMDFHGAPFGFFHIAIAVGCWKIEWNASHLCIPRMISAQASIVCADIESIATLDELDFVRDRLAEVIVKWNTTMYYKERDGSPERDHTGNCQQFIDEILSILKIDDCYAQFPIPLVNYLKKLRDEGYGEMEFEFDDVFKKKFFPENKPDLKIIDEIEDQEQTDKETKIMGIWDQYKNKSKIVFKTHEQLDVFVAYLICLEPEFMTTHKHEYYLLKSFDRAYWMRYLKDGDNATFHPYDCPFSDPQLTSILKIDIRKNG